MASITTRKTDVIWNYIGTIVSMSSGFILLPLLMLFLTDDELGLWYVYLALSNFALLFEFGFSPTFARNIVYVVSGARRLSVKGCDNSSVEEGIDWHLLNTVIKASKVIYSIIAVVVTALLATIGSAYVAHVSPGFDSSIVWGSWPLFCVSVFLNLYFLWSVTVLRGYGDVAGEKKSLVISKVGQLAVSAVLLIAGFGLVGAAIGYLVGAVLLRAAAVLMMRRHREIEDGRRSDTVAVEALAIKEIFLTIFHVAWRDGLVQLALYASTQATSILSSLFLGLAETGMYSILLQFSNAIYSFASAYPNSFFPAMQSAYAEAKTDVQRHYVCTGIVGYWALSVLGTIGVCAVFLPLLPLFKPNVSVDFGLFVLMCLYLGLLNQHSIFCNYIVGMNEVPYMWGYILAAVVGTVLVCLLCGVLGMGAWGIILGQAVSQLIYNNWKWPVYLCSKIGFSYRECLREGVGEWKAKLLGNGSRKA
ncbi:O-unit flippase-like protein [Senegalimassilia anaerobia]